MAKTKYVEKKVQIRESFYKKLLKVKKDDREPIYKQLDVILKEHFKK